GGVFSAILFNATSGTSKAIHSVCPETSSSTYNIPTVLQGLKLLHENFGHLSWAKLFDSAIRLAKNGFSIDETLASALKSDMEKIKSDLCDLFCHKNGSIKGQGSKVTNQKLSELLQTVSVLMENNSHFSETLGMKLAEDLPQTEKPDFVKNVQRCKGEINDPFTVKKDKYTVFTAAPPVFGGIISDILKRAGEHNLSLQSIADLNSRASSYINLLNAAKLIYSNSLAMEHQSPGDLFALNTVGSHIGVLDSSGNVLIISASLNSSFGLKQFLPSTGVILNDFTVHSAPNMLSWNCLSVLKFQDDDEIIGIGVTGGKSVPYLVTQIIINKVHYKMSFQEAVRGPFFHLEMTNPKLFSTYISGISNTSDIFKLLIDKEPQIKTMDETGEDFLALILDSYAGHVGAFGIPPANAHSDGY
ncbi:GGT6 hydrolase, partial [Atractosteus spatula]|nr:GGT6 hydrolase [Atractosteus spatula]